MGCLLAALLYFISWAITCVIVKFIGACFGVAVSLVVATGIWLCLMLIKHIIWVIKKYIKEKLKILRQLYIVLNGDEMKHLKSLEFEYEIDAYIHRLIMEKL